METWSPQPAGLQEILQTIHDSTDMTVIVQRTITQVRTPLHLLRASHINPGVFLFLLEIEPIHACAGVHRLPGLYS